MPVTGMDFGGRIGFEMFSAQCWPGSHPAEAAARGQARTVSAQRGQSGGWEGREPEPPAQPKEPEAQDGLGCVPVTGRSTFAGRSGPATGGNEQRGGC